MNTESDAAANKFTTEIQEAVSNVVIAYSYHVTYAFQSEFTLYSCLNVKELLAQSRLEI